VVNPPYDVVVVGLGGMGSSTIYNLANRGFRVIGVDRFGPGHSYGSSHGGARIVRRVYFEAPEYEPLLRRTYELWFKLSRDSGEATIRSCGALIIGGPKSQTIQGSIRSAALGDVPYELLDTEDIQKRFPNLSPPVGSVGFYDAEAGFVNPEATVRLNLRLASAAGADFLFHCNVTAWEDQSTGGIAVKTDHGEIYADRVVLTTGAWAPELLGDIDIHLEAERQIQFWFDSKPDTDRWTPERQPIWILERSQTESWAFGFPITNGTSVKVGFEEMGTPADPSSLERTVSEAEIAAVRSKLIDIAPSLATAQCVRATACMYENTADGNFIIGKHPYNADVIVGCGFSGHGYKFVPVIGEILADLAIDDVSAFPLGRFSPSRPMIRSGSQQRR
jgi:sarcosine oxidase